MLQSGERQASSQGPDEWLESSGRTVPRVSVTVTGSASRYMVPFNPDLSEDGRKYRLSVEDLQLVKASMEELVSCPSGGDGDSGDSLPSVTGVLHIMDTGEESKKGGKCIGGRRTVDCIK